MKKLKVMLVFGTRPEAIKMAPLVLELQKHSDSIETITVVTAQHRQMLDQVLETFSIKPHYDLDIMGQNQSLLDITGKILEKFDPIVKQERPDMILVHGDTTTTFAASLVAFYNQVRIGHVEAGLRTFDKYSPFPEEMNRKLTGSIATYHFAPTASSESNLKKENINTDHLYVTGNTVIDALDTTVQDNYVFDDAAINALDPEKRTVLVTTHRRENLGEPMRHVYQAIRDLINEFEDIQVVFPVHKNPKVRQVVQEELGSVERVTLIDPLDYEPFANLMAKSYLILTDSGGIQEEAPALGKPVLVLRDTTERPEAVEAGTVRLVGTDKDAVHAAAHELLSNAAAYKLMSNSVNPYGDGKASERIIQALRHEFLGDSNRPERFGK